MNRRGEKPWNLRGGNIIVRNGTTQKKKCETSKSTRLGKKVIYFKINLGTKANIFVFHDMFP